MKIGDKIIIKDSFSVDRKEGCIISSIPGEGSKSYLIKIHYKRPLFLALKDAEFLRDPHQKGSVSLKDRFCMEQGSDGTIVSSLPHSRYLCEFEGPFCNIELTEDEIVKWNPEAGVFALLNTVRLKEDIPEHGLKKGMEGVIILVYFEPSLAYEVEFYFGEDAKPEFDAFTFLPSQLEFVADRPLG